jgi:hypothetical protein
LKLIVAFTVVAALAAGPALAQGTFNNGRKPATGFGTPSSSAPQPAPSYGQAPSTAGKPKTYGTPPAAGGGFKPYEPFKPGSVYSSQTPSASGAKPCETSVYTNACKPGR